MHLTCPGEITTLLRTHFLLFQMLLFCPTVRMVMILTLGFLILSLLDPALLATALALKPHQHLNSTWQVLTSRRDSIWSASKITGQPWWPDLHPDLCMLATLTSPDCHMDDQSLTVKAPNLYDSYYDRRPRPPGCANSTQRKKIASQRFYVCPGSHWDHSLLYKCGVTDYFCRSWGCETTGNTYWSPSSSWDFITMTHNYSLGHLNTHAGAPKCGDWCHPLKIQFTDPGKTGCVRDRRLDSPGG